MFSASFPAMLLPEDSAKGFHVRFPDLSEALTGGDDFEDALAQAADCLAEAIAGRIARGDEIPPPSKPKRGQRLIGVPIYLAPKLALYLAMRERRMRCPAYVKPETRQQAAKYSGGARGVGKTNRYCV